MPTIPPWISTTPAQWGDLAAKGAELGIQREKLSFDEQQTRDAAAADAAKTAMSMQLAARGAALQEAKFKSDQQMNVLSAQMAKDNADKSYQYKMQQLAVSRELGARRSEATALAAAQKYQQAQSYQRKVNELVSSGVPMSEAAVQASMLTGHFPAGMASLMRPQEAWKIDPSNPNRQISSTGRISAIPNERKEDNHKLRSEYMKMFLDANKDKPDYLSGGSGDIMKDAAAFADAQVGGAAQNQVVQPVADSGTTSTGNKWKPVDQQESSTSSQPKPSPEPPKAVAPPESIITGTQVDKDVELEKRAEQSRSEADDASKRKSAYAYSGAITNSLESLKQEKLRQISHISRNYKNIPSDSWTGGTMTAKEAQRKIKSIQDEIKELEGKMEKPDKYE
jgi:hypothetical protein